MSISKMYVVAAGVLLIGYAVFNKGFAYLGYPPIFIGEVFLLFSALVLLMGGYTTRVLHSPITWTIIIFMIWGAARTLPFLEVYGLNAVRDSVVWLYGTYAIFIGSALLRSRTLGLVPKWYNAWFPWFLVIAPPSFILSHKFGYLIPTYPGSGRIILSMKPGDMAVHLAGVAGFMGLGLHRRFAKHGGTVTLMREFGLWMIWGLGVIIAGSRNRGGLVAVIVACLVILAFKPASRLNRVILPGVIVVLLAISFDVQVPIGGNRNISVQQIIDNVESVMFKDKRITHSDTASWRILWWERIRDETIGGDYFWDGRGYGEKPCRGAWFRGRHRKSKSA